MIPAYAFMPHMGEENREYLIQVAMITLRLHTEDGQFNLLLVASHRTG